MPQMQVLTCCDRWGHTADFEYTAERDMSDAGWTYRVRPKGADPSGEFFELTVVELEGASVRLTMLNNNRCAAVSGKGIPDALIPRIAEELGRRVQSSPSRGAAADVFRTADATKVWERLVAAGKAQYNPQTDVYSTR